MREQNQLPRNFALLSLVFLFIALKLECVGGREKNQMTIYGVFGYGDKQVYVGTTYNPLRVRMSQHKYAAKKYNWLHKGEANRFYWYFTSGVWECRTLEI